MKATPSPEQDRVGFGATAALVAAQLAAGVVVALLGLLLPGAGSGLSAVGGLVGSMSYALWAEGRAPGCLTPKLTRRLAFWASVAQFFVAIPIVALHAFVSSGTDKALSPRVWIIVLAIAFVIAFLVTWLGLAQGRRMAERARLKKTGGA